MSLRSGIRTTRDPIASGRNLPVIGTLQQQNIGILELNMLEELRVLGQPGAIIAVLAVLSLMAAGDAAIIIAAKGWPF